MQCCIARPDGSLDVLAGVRPAARSGARLVPLRAEDVIPLPDTATLAHLPGRRALALSRSGEPVTLGDDAVPVAAVLLGVFGWVLYRLLIFRIVDADLFDDSLHDPRRRIELAGGGQRLCLDEHDHRAATLEASRTDPAGGRAGGNGTALAPERFGEQGARGVELIERHITLRVELRNAADQNCLRQSAKAACNLRAGQAELIGDQVEVVDAVLGFGFFWRSPGPWLGLAR